MNKERMYVLADLIDTISPEKFNISNWTLDVEPLPDGSGYYYNNQEIHANLSAYDCGTAGCIAGWAVALKNDLDLKSFPLSSVSAEASDYLGLTIGEANSLFFFGQKSIWHKYHSELGFYEDLSYDGQIKSKHAAYALRELADGNWEF